MFMFIRSKYGRAIRDDEITAASGSVTLDGQDLQKAPPHKIINMGLAHVPEGRHVFARMTVEENLRMGAYILKNQHKINENLEKVYAHFPRLKERWKQLAAMESCIIVGRCGNYLLRDMPNVLRVFIHAPLEARHERVASYSLTKTSAEIARYIRMEDKRRANYYRYYTGEEWRDAAGYDLCLDSAALGENGCVNRIIRLLPDFMD